MSEEAFEIGVTLALSDGVSEGIDRARRDMAQLERALLTGGVSVAALRQMATTAAVPEAAARRTQPEMRREVAAQPTPAEQEARTDVHKEAASAGPLDLHPSMAAVPALRAMPDRMAVPFAPAVPDASRVSRAEGAIVAAASPGRPPADAAPMPKPIDLPPSDTSSLLNKTRPAPSPVATSAPVLPLSLPSQGDAAAQAGVQDRLRESVARTLPAAQQAETRVSLSAVMTQRPNTSPAETGPTARTAMAPWAEPIADADGLAAPQDNFTDGNSAKDQKAAYAPLGAGGSAHTAASAPGNGLAEPAQSGPTQGDVFLDGMLVGRWMSRFLTQEAGRAQAGPTGFDARRGRLLPGPTVGG